MDGRWEEECSLFFGHRLYSIQRNDQLGMKGRNSHKYFIGAKFPLKVVILIKQQAWYLR